jgi:ribose 5-phosphate isomerase RpiB
MQVAVAADHAGFELKQRVLKWLLANGYAALDLGTDSEEQ